MRDIDVQAKDLQAPMILTPCPYDPIKWGAGSMILTPCPYDPIK